MFTHDDVGKVFRVREKSGKTVYYIKIEKPGNAFRMIPLEGEVEFCIWTEARTYGGSLIEAHWSSYAHKWHGSLEHCFIEEVDRLTQLLLGMEE
jgi:hypothetical protein